PPRPPVGEPAHPAELPAVPGRGDGEREAGQHDEDHDRELAVDEPPGPERSGAFRITREAQQVTVVESPERGGQTADAVQTAQPSPGGLARRRLVELLRMSWHAKDGKRRRRRHG